VEVTESVMSSEQWAAMYIELFGDHPFVAEVKARANAELGRDVAVLSHAADSESKIGGS
jgi:hypothetical protein